MLKELGEKLTALPAAFISQDGKRLRFVAYLFLVMLCVGFFTPGLVTMPPTDRDESSFAQASKQMIETGNYVDIRLQNEPRYKKPIGIYWLQSASVRALSPGHLNDIWAYRIPSFLGATAAVLMTAALGSLLFSPATGLLAAMMMAGSALLNVEARLAKTDAVLLGCIVTAMVALARAYQGKQTPGNALLFWTSLAFGLLIKGPMILLPVLSTLLWIRLSDKDISWARALHPLPGLLWTLALVSPWFVAISMQSHGAFIQQSAGHDLLAKLWQGQNRGIVPPGAHLAALPLTFFPFSLFVLWAIPGAWKNRVDPSVKFCLGWIVPTWIVFELSLTKLPHYVLPVYPALALLAAHALLGGFPVASKLPRLSAWLISAFWLVLGAGFAALIALLPWLSDHDLSPLAIAAGTVLVLSQTGALFLLRRHKTAAFSLLTAGLLTFFSIAFGETIPALRHVWLSREIVETAAEIAPCPAPRLIAAGYHEPSLVFLAGTETILANSGQTAAAALQQGGCRIAVIAEDQKQAFFDAFADAPVRPEAAARIEGLNTGHGSTVRLSFYLMPSETPHEPAP